MPIPNRLTSPRVHSCMDCPHLIHLAIAACAGHWTPGQPIAKGKGVFFNDLLELDRNHASPVNLNLDLCARVRVTLAGDSER